MKRLKPLEEENVWLKRLVADLSLDKPMLQDVVKRHVWSAPSLQVTWAPTSLQSKTESWVAVTAIVTVFLCSVERRFSALAVNACAVGHSLGQPWPQATAKPARSGVDAGEHSGTLISRPAARHRAPSAAGPRYNPVARRPARRAPDATK